MENGFQIYSEKIWTDALAILQRKYPQHRLKPLRSFVDDEECDYDWGECFKSAVEDLKKVPEIKARVLRLQRFAQADEDVKSKYVQDETRKLMHCSEHLGNEECVEGDDWDDGFHDHGKRSPPVDDGDFVFDETSGEDDSEEFLTAEEDADESISDE